MIFRVPLGAPPEVPALPPPESLLAPPTPAQPARSVAEAAMTMNADRIPRLSSALTCTGCTPDAPFQVRSTPEPWRGNASPEKRFPGGCRARPRPSGDDSFPRWAGRVQVRCPAVGTDAHLDRTWTRRRMAIGGSGAPWAAHMQELVLVRHGESLGNVADAQARDRGEARLE